MEPIEGSETSAFKPQTPGKYPKENTLHKEHGESLKSSQELTYFDTLGALSYGLNCIFNLIIKDKIMLEQKL